LNIPWRISNTQVYTCLCNGDNRREWYDLCRTPSFHTLCVGTADYRRQKNLFLRVVFLLIVSSILLLAPTHLSAQSLQQIYSDLNNATSLSITQNSIYVVEQGKNHLVKLDHQGNLTETIGGRGSGNYEFSRPVDVDATNGLKIFVTDYNNRRVQVFDRRGQYLSSIQGGNRFGENRRYIPTHIAVNGLGEVYFVDENRRSILHFDQDYNLTDEFRVSTEIRNIDGLQLNSDQIFILDKASGTIHRLSANGSYQGFYPANGVQTFNVSGEGIWMSYENQVVLEDRSQDRKTISFDQQIFPVDMQLQNQTLYILTSTAVYKIAIEGS